MGLRNVTLALAVSYLAANVYLKKRRQNAQAGGTGGAGNLFGGSGGESRARTAMSPLESGATAGASTASGSGTRPAVMSAGESGGTRGGEAGGGSAGAGLGGAMTGSVGGHADLLSSGSGGESGGAASGGGGGLAQTAVPGGETAATGIAGVGLETPNPAEGLNATRAGSGSSGNLFDSNSQDGPSPKAPGLPDMMRGA
jgi:hypothetical protein